MHLTIYIFQLGLLLISSLFISPFLFSESHDQQDANYFNDNDDIITFGVEPENTTEEESFDTRLESFLNESLPEEATQTEQTKKKTLNPFFFLFSNDQEDNQENDQTEENIFQFGDNLSNEENTEELGPITSHFECYDKTSDVDKALCLDNDTSILYEQVQELYRQKMAISPLHRINTLRKQKQYWEARIRYTCITDLICLQEEIKKQIVTLLDYPILGKWTYPAIDASIDGITIGVKGIASAGTYELTSVVLFDGTSDTIVHNIDFYTIVDSQYISILHPQPNPYILDANFDNQSDFIFIVGDRNKDIHRLYLFYDSQKNKLITNRKLNTLQNPMFIDAYKIIGVSLMKDTTTIFNYYTFTDLTKIKIALQSTFIPIIDTRGERMYTNTSAIFVGGKKVIKQRKNVYANEIGNIPDFYIEESNAIMQVSDSTTEQPISIPIQ